MTAMGKSTGKCVKLTFPAKMEMEVRMPGSKSISNRAIIAASLAKGKSTLRNVSSSDDTRKLVDIVRQLGVGATYESDGSLTIDGQDGHICGKDGSFNVENTGTVMRFLLPFLSIGEGEYILDGNERMRQRPIDDLLQAVNDIGGDVRPLNNDGAPPIRVKAHGLRGGIVRLKSDRSSQFASSLLLSAPYMEKGLDLQLVGEVSSRSYIDMTVDMMNSFGVIVRHEGTDRHCIQADKKYRGTDLTIAGDASGANYFLAMAAVRGGRATIRGVHPDRESGEGRFARFLESMGCTITRERDRIALVGDGALQGATYDFADMPDSAQTAACVALFAEGKTTLKNIGNLRFKETDRIKALAIELTKLGATVAVNGGDVTIVPSKTYRPTVVETYEDHRMVMSFAVASAKIDGLLLQNPDCVSKSFPTFFDLLARNGVGVSYIEKPQTNL